MTCRLYLALPCWETRKSLEDIPTTENTGDHSMTLFHALFTSGILIQAWMHTNAYVEKTSNSYNFKKKERLLKLNKGSGHYMSVAEAEDTTIIF